VESFPPAFAAGQRVLDAGPTTPSLAEYHRAILRALGVRRPAPRLLWELEQPGARPLVEPFPEVPGVLERLRAGGVRMAVVSDNWPGLEACTASSACTPTSRPSPSRRTWAAASPIPACTGPAATPSACPRRECLFVDDDPDLVAAAIGLGYGGTAIIRTAEPPTTVPWIGTLEELVPMTGT
jgi:putative hydrolase of the HAD superfamily